MRNEAGHTPTDSLPPPPWSAAMFEAALIVFALLVLFLIADAFMN
jgi:hypothetical protein